MTTRPARYTGPVPTDRQLRTNATDQGTITLRPFTTMIDWLTIMMHGPFYTITNEPGSVFPWLVDNGVPDLAVYCAGDIGVPHFRKVFYIMDRSGCKLVTICCDPRDRKKFPPEFSTVQFANDTLAPGTWHSLYDSLRMMGCEYIGVQQVDIAADGWENVDGSIGGGGDFLPVVLTSFLGISSYYGKAHWKTHHTGRLWNGFEFGTKSGNKFLRCYRKKREMKAKGHKEHIAAAWRAALNGYDAVSDPREVGRLEVKLKGRELRRYWPGERNDDELSKLNDPKFRVDLFSSATSTMFDFRTWPTDGRARTARPVIRWDFSLCTTNAPENMPRAQRSRRIDVARAKRGLHEIYDVYLRTGDQDVLRILERNAAAMGQEFLDYIRRNERQWQALDRALTVGTKKRPGTDDRWTLNYLRNLAHGVDQDKRDTVRTFMDRAEVYADPPDPDDIDPF